MRLILLAILFLTNSALADDKVIHTSVPTNFSPEEAYGVAISNERVAVIPGRIQQRENSSSIPVVVSSGEGTTLVASILKDSSGNYITSELTSPVESATKALCPNSIDDKNLASAQPAILQALVQVRAEKRALYQEKISKLLSGEFLTTIRRLESGFGLGGSVPISADMSPYELSERISALAVVLGNLEGQKK